MKPARFTYHRARDVGDANALLRELGEEAKIIAGGQSLMAMMNFRLARPEHLVDIGGLRHLDYIRRDGDALRIGALTTHHSVERAPAESFGDGYDVIRNAMQWIGHLPIRTRGTVAGSLAHGDATAEWCLLATLLDAYVVVTGPDGERTIEAEDLFLGFYSTTLEYDEMITEVVFPRPAPFSALTEFAERRGDFATVAALVDLHVEDNLITEGRVVLGGVAPLPLRLPAAEAMLVGSDLTDPKTFTRFAAAAAESIDPPSDANGSSDYRRTLTRTLIEQACKEALS
jgi:carbon-monoxide dehydrogenase medium subunit